ncbi:hypothetical protein KHS38_15470 [Mucilaginibacter sp. Bleaf8]|uniref:hypothetical protein n=1 Tax=Mucilaginibacter sp. Bleaf8 TaxID=2834430 RepID=UPI001BCEAB44|nr:hypothetical protein [Mucilaginibacter sp. Bleaf8]MBS7565806.1 hypothetical protein [Mucilaginibacter sp. Bleaf8]
MMLLAIQTGSTFWLTAVVCAIVVILLFFKIIKFWLKALLVLGLVLLVGKCYFSKKTTHRRAGVVSAVSVGNKV